MRTNRLIILISTIFSLVVNMPRLSSLFGKGDHIINGLVEVSPGDTIFKILMLFTYSYVILIFNINWIDKVQRNCKTLSLVVINISIFFTWVLSFKILNSMFYGNDDFIINERALGFAYLFVMTILIIISRAIRLSIQSKADAIEKEKLIQQNLQNELAALKNQLNPHFLFNSFNSLSLLVREDQKAAGKFINKLSFIYRYLLQSKDQNLVSLKDELKFLESYIHLIKVRYQDNFSVRVSINENLFSLKIPTLALQLLMENAVKHNEISNDYPLNVEVYNDDNYLIVKNKLKARTGFVETMNMGLNNLNARFKIYMNKEIQIMNDGDYFTVKLPIK